MSAQRYSTGIARDRMADDNCPECGQPADMHSPEPRFWVRGSGCDLLPHGVTERIQQYRDDIAAQS